MRTQQGSFTKQKGVMRKMKELMSFGGGGEAASQSSVGIKFHMATYSIPPTQHTSIVTCSNP